MSFKEPASQHFQKHIANPSGRSFLNRKHAPAVTNEPAGRKFKKLIPELAPEEICPRIECCGTVGAA
jgi:hypothetical protein